MKQSKEKPDSDGRLELGTLLGRRQAFSTVAGRCSAADAACLREIRSQKAYRSLGMGWKEFCSQKLGMSQVHANRLIGYLDEFGPPYFDLAQLTGISPDEYRAIAPAVKDQAIHHGGQVIALLPENSEKLATALSELRRETADVPVSAPAPSAGERLHRLERQSAALANEIRKLLHTIPPEERVRLGSALIEAIQQLERLRLEFGPLA